MTQVSAHCRKKSKNGKSSGLRVMILKFKKSIEYPAQYGPMIQFWTEYWKNMSRQKVALAT